MREFVEDDNTATATIDVRAHSPELTLDETRILQLHQMTIGLNLFLISIQ